MQGDSITERKRVMEAWVAKKQEPEISNEELYRLVTDSLAELFTHRGYKSAKVVPSTGLSTPSYGVEAGDKDQIVRGVVLKSKLTINKQPLMQLLAEMWRACKWTHLVVVASEFNPHAIVAAQSEERARKVRIELLPHWVIGCRLHETLLGRQCPISAVMSQEKARSLLIKSIDPMKLPVRHCANPMVLTSGARVGDVLHITKWRGPRCVTDAYQRVDRLSADELAKHVRMKTKETRDDDE